MKILYWNVNGIRSILKKTVDEHQSESFESYIARQNCDIVIFAETKICCKSRDAHAGLANLFTNKYPYAYHAHSIKRGYSGVSIYSREQPIKVSHLDNKDGRIVALEYKRIIVIGVYVMNSGHGLKNLSKRDKEWDPMFLSLCKKLSKSKPIIVAGDMNVAHEEIDINHPERHHNSPGFTDTERRNFTKLLSKANLLDVWRTLHPTKVAYTYFDYRSRARSRNAGWRLDYFLVSHSIARLVKQCTILPAYGSDHLPIVLVIEDSAK